MKTFGIDFLALVKFIIMAALAFIAPIQTYIYCIIAIVFIDALTGIGKARKANNQITSRKLSVTLSKLLFYFACMVGAYLVETIVKIPAFQITRIITTAISLIELKSILENTNAILGTDLWQVVVNYLKRNQNDITKDVTSTLDSDKK